MKIVKYELSLVQKKELILTMEDNVDSEDLLKIFLETQVKEEKEQDGLIGIIAEKVSEESCTEQCESCQKYCPASEECMATDENVRCTECEYLCKTCGRCELKEEKDFAHDCGQECKECGFACTNVVAVQIQCWNYRQESICFSDGKFSDTLEQRDGCRRIHNTSKQRLWIATQVPCLSVLWQLVRENPWNPYTIVKIWRNRRHEENDFIYCRNIYRKCSRCNRNVYFTGE